MAFPTSLLSVKLFCASSMAAAKLVPCSDTMPVEMASMKSLAAAWSDVMGSWGYASPANTPSAILSPAMRSARLATSSLARSSLLGSTSLAIMEFDTSTMTTASMPWVVSVCCFSPYCGRATATMSNAAANRARANLMCLRHSERPGINASTMDGWPSLRNRLRVFRQDQT